MVVLYSCYSFVGVTISNSKINDQSSEIIQKAKSSLFLIFALCIKYFQIPKQMNQFKYL